MLPSRKQTNNSQEGTAGKMPLAGDLKFPPNRSCGFEFKHHRRDSHPLRMQNMSGRVIKHKKHRSQPVNLFVDNDLLQSSGGVDIPHAHDAIEDEIFLFTNNQLHAVDQTASPAGAHGVFDEVHPSDAPHYSTQSQATTQSNVSSASCGQDCFPPAQGDSYSLFLQRSNTVSSQIHNPLLSSRSSSLNRVTRPSLIQTNVQHFNGIIASKTATHHSRMTHGRRHSVDVATIRQPRDFLSLSDSGLPSPPNTAPLLPITTLDIAPMPHPDYVNLAAFVASPSDIGSESYCSAESNIDDSASSTYSSPNMNIMDLDHQFTGKGGAEFSAQEPNTRGGDNLPSLAPAPKSRGSGSGALSRETRVPGGFVKASGISHEEISAFISGPEASDGKWVCLYADCNKRFGRKENIKSHVQTHLGDRQYRCEVCKKCFVRQHDLKRHAKIHTGVKPYPCRCGNSFARHDALTRHRQRGMCIGAFEGIIKKVVKRGRPKKVRKFSDPEEHEINRNPKKKASKSNSSSYTTSIPPTSPLALDEEDILEMSATPEAPTSPFSTNSAEGGSKPENARMHGLNDTISSENSEKCEDSLFSGKFQNRGYEILAELSECTPPSSPPHLFDDGRLIENGNSMTSSEMNSLEEDTSFTPIGSPSYEIIHRKLASAYNTPEWAGTTLVGDASDTLDLGDILGLSEFVSDPAALSFETGDPVSWRKNNGLDLNLGLDLNMGIDMNEDAFDFIKPELLQEETLDFLETKSR